MQTRKELHQAVLARLAETVIEMPSASVIQPYILISLADAAASGLCVGTQVRWWRPRP